MISTGSETTQTGPFRTGPNGLQLIKNFEGLRLHAYQDTRGIWTIGWGDTANVKRGDTISISEAEARLVHRLTYDFEPTVNRVAIAPGTTQNQFDAMVSLAYNIGSTNFITSTLARLHKAGAFERAEQEFGRWIYSNGERLTGLVTRRKAEAQLYGEKLSSRPG